MKNTVSKNARVLAVVPSSEGLGFAVLDTNDTLVEWGGTRTKGEKNAQAVKKVEKMIRRYVPEVVVMEDGSAKGSQRRSRFQAVTKEIATAARKHGVKVVLLPQSTVRKLFFDETRGTKHAVAGIVAQRFSEELGHRLPPERELWKSEAKRMVVFEAVALGMALYAMIKPNCKERPVSPRILG